MLVSIILLNYNTFNYTCQCIDSIVKHTSGIDYEIVVVDNASTKDNPDIFVERYPFIMLVKSPENGGFAKGNNLGIAHAKGDIVLLLNNDTYLTENSIAKSLEYLGTKEKLLAVKLVYENGRYQSNARKFRSIRNELLDLVRPVLYLLPYRKRAKLMLNQYFKGDFDTDCDWVSGAYMMFPKSALERLPGKKLDERFFMYGEDQLWCYQFREAGYKTGFLSSTTVVHIANASVEPAKQLQLLKLYISRELDIIAYRKGKGLYYFFFCLIFSFKEQMRYYIKVLAYNLFKYRIR